jgi:peroxiredoxin
LVVLRVDTKESREVVAKFFEKEGLQSVVLLDKTGKVTRLYGVWAHPTSFLIDRKGLVRYRAMGGIDWIGFEATSVIDALLREQK